ncbi:L-rhamnose/proton symporter RhaT [uncultured Parabacteroides sp.]|jgi:L-rhamnose-H+ transport protein|uniref:L-rhamnose/proton symporter RhaT n=1 Tax=uncultured Parabacteroides sp. TaxID=512312 RepID=UPI0025FB8C90|nr:L-rhamnose/proton symporter RhaT [uncultured Parabacteroides sp.]
MTIELFLGIGLIAVGAFSSGSFSIPFGKTRGWAWENYWLIYSLFAYVLVPAIACGVFCPGFMDVLSGVPAGTLAWIFLLGIVYGICNLTFGLSLRYLGLSLGFSLSLGLMMILGTIIPPAIDGRLAVMLQQSGGTMLIAGLLIAAVGIAFSGYAGYRKDKGAGPEANSELNFGKGLILVFFVGITGASQALGIEQGSGISSSLVASGIDPLFQTLPVFLLMFGGSFVATALWCLFLAGKNNNLKAFAGTKEIAVSKNYLYCGLAGFLWFVNFIFYGMGKSRMGEFSFTAWGILMSLTIVFATLWGLCRGEWKATDLKTKGWMYAGLVVLIVASFIIGMSGGE